MAGGAGEGEVGASIGPVRLYGPRRPARRWAGMSPALARLGRRVMTCFSRFVKALVTGGAGFIGSHLADALVAGGHEVHVVDDLSTGRVDNLESALEGGAAALQALMGAVCKTDAAQVEAGSQALPLPNSAAAPRRPT